MTSDARKRQDEAAQSAPARPTAVGALIATGGLISELMEIQDNVLILAEQRDQAEAERGYSGCPGDNLVRWFDDLRALLSSDGTAVRADDRAGDAS